MDAAPAARGPALLRLRGPDAGRRSRGPRAALDAAPGRARPPQLRQRGPRGARTATVMVAGVPPAVSTFVVLTASDARFARRSPRSAFAVSRKRSTRVACGASA